MTGEGPQESDDTTGILKILSGTYQVDASESTIEWEGRNPSSTHKGSVSLSRGTITVQANQISGIFEIDMNSIRNKNLEGDPLQAALEDHLKSDDFFFTSMFPKAVFTMTEATVDLRVASSIPNAQVSGQFELRGVHKDLSFPATLSTQPDGIFSVESHFDLDRTRWNIIYGSTRFFEHLDKHLVFDHFTVQIRIIAVLAV